SQMSCQKIISGGQTGVDRGALDAALETGFFCGGWCPAGRMAEDGSLDKKYPLTEIPEGTYSDRTKKNVEFSDGTIIITNNVLTGGTKLTYDYAILKNKPVFLLKISQNDNRLQDKIFQINNWINKNQICILNIAGPRKSEWNEGYMISKTITTGLIKTF
ncbi:MAG: putative molybdenum carrier protein, partial [Prolixibacteraceae bacterium]|nr:putative molybdenum carrier protein [Prolixibacteraceae bacterium]